MADAFSPRPSSISSSVPPLPELQISLTVVMESEANLADDRFDQFCVRSSLAFTVGRHT